MYHVPNSRYRIDGISQQRRVLLLVGNRHRGPSITPHDQRQTRE
jgi:hypothetical protein